MKRLDLLASLTVGLFISGMDDDLCRPDATQQIGIIFKSPSYKS